MSLNLAGLYAITDEILTPDNSVIEKVKEALEKGVRIFQYRNKSAKDSEIFEIVKELRDLIDKENGLFVLNDRVELAEKVKAHGVHVGEDDLDISEVKKIFSGFIGVSCYGDIERAKEMEKLGADYVAFGSFFKSPTKPKSYTVPLEVLSKAKNKLSIPICAIGGINSENISKVREHNPDMISLVSGIFGGDISENIEKLS
jgi:thiamine-phosphate pyrophosphorylase